MMSFGISHSLINWETNFKDLKSPQMAFSWLFLIINDRNEGSQSFRTIIFEFSMKNYVYMVGYLLFSIKFDIGPLHGPSLRPRKLRAKIELFLKEQITNHIDVIFHAEFKNVAPKTLCPFISVVNDQK